MDTISTPVFLAQHISNHAAGFSADDIPDLVRTRATHLMLDAIGIAFASTGHNFSRVTLNAFKELSAGASEVPIIGMGEKLSARDAAIVNALLMHGLDYDDTHPRGVVHPSTSVLPAVLSQGMMRRSSGSAMLAAYVLGVEVVTRLASAAEGAFHQVGFHPTGLIGAFGCVAAAGYLQGLNANQLTHAQGIVLSMASGSLEFLQDGAWTKRIHPGWAAHAGITAATLARHGFIGPQAVYEGRFGLYKSHLGQSFPVENAWTEIATLGQAWELMSVAVKPIPACHFTHACADAAAALSHQIDVAKVRRIVAKVPAGVMKTVCEPIDAKRAPANSYEAQFSIPYSVARGLKFGGFDLKAIERSAYTDADTIALAHKVECVADPDADFPRFFSGEVVVELADGSVRRHRESVNRGAGQRPISNEDILTKYRENTTGLLPPAQIERVAHAILDIEAQDAEALMTLLNHETDVRDENE